LSGRDGFGAFVEVKCIFSTTPEAENFSKSSWIGTEVTGSERMLRSK
jgi:CYTH domain-containing protein